MEGSSIPESSARRALGLLLLAAALVYSGWMMSHGLEGPFHRDYLGRNGARYSLMARNALRHDVSLAHYAPLVNAEKMTSPDPYLHHPPLLHWVMAVTFAVLGETENHARMIPLVFTLLNLLLLYLLGRRIMGGSLAGGMTALMAAALPMTGYYGVHIDVQGSPLFCCILCSTLFFCYWTGSSKRIHLVLSLLFLVIGTLFDWPALYLCLLFPLFHRMTGRTAGQALKKNLPFIVVGLCLFISLFLWLTWAGTSKGTTLFESLVVRSVKPEMIEGMTSRWDYFLYQLNTYCLPGIHALFPWPVLALLGLGWLAGRFAPSRGPDRSRRAALWFFFLLGFLHIALFPLAGLLFHDYWAFLLVPWVALLSTQALLRMAALPGDDGPGFRILGWIVAGAAALVVIMGGHRYTLARYDAHLNFQGFALGTILHEAVKPEEAVITNGNYNPPSKGGDGYSLVRPELTYYSDRVIRGTVDSAEELEALLPQRDDFTYFAYLPVPRMEEADRRFLTYLESRYPVERNPNGVAIPDTLIMFRLK